MKETLSNKQVSVSVNLQGAELCSFWDKEDGVEHIWQAYPDVWGRHAPILFPIVGKVEDNKLVAKGETFDVGQHGFARDMKFNLIEKTHYSMTFQLKSSPETMKKYPYFFVLKVKYILQGKSLVIEFSVSNPADDDMYFSIGAHPGFTCPFNDGESFEDYYLEFNEKETADRITLAESGLRDGKVVEEYLDNTSEIALTETLFDDDALIFENLKSTTLAIKSKKHDKSLTVDFTGFPLMGIWSKPKANAPYVCIEPWYGVADEEGKGGDFVSKKAIQKLPPKGEFISVMKYSIS